MDPQRFRPPSPSTPGERPADAQDYPGSPAHEVGQLDSGSAASEVSRSADRLRFASEREAGLKLVRRLRIAAR